MATTSSYLLPPETEGPTIVWGVGYPADPSTDPVSWAQLSSQVPISAHLTSLHVTLPYFALPLLRTRLPSAWVGEFLPSGPFHHHCRCCRCCCPDNHKIKGESAKTSTVHGWKGLVDHRGPLTL